eukprot:CAMPEP_0119129446 /NCGR_PEP_ID=MMETSP1310-20130426/7189_1 /TAXON_ID=464262 /ORGANISM="Genus nov. species nov., Strain RCC2339" /LENGTH=384 /DNA_ID=CAMNT_0007119865 /DNA_START=93 /DNA_END=1244 /DNA_ORIENTATION=-
MPRSHLIYVVVAVFTVRGIASSYSWCSGVDPPSPPNARDDLLRIPYLTHILDGEACVTWGVNVHLTGRCFLEYTANGGLSWSRVAAIEEEYSWYNYHALPKQKEMRQCRVNLTGLPPSTPVCYRVLEEDSELAGGYSFTSAPAPGSAAPFSFMAYGDFGRGKGSPPFVVTDSPQARVRDTLVAWWRAEDPELLLALGDDTYFSGYEHEYDHRTFPYYEQLWSQLPLFLTSGNHDYESDRLATYLKYFYQPDPTVEDPSASGRYFSFDWRNVHFVMLDTEWYRWDSPGNLSASGMVEWFRRDLEANTQPWTIVAQHKMPYTGSAVADANVVTYLMPIYEEFRIPLVVGGHWHNYQRYAPLRNGTRVPTTEGGVTYVISGGGGYHI